MEGDIFAAPGCAYRGVSVILSSGRNVATRHLAMAPRSPGEGTTRHLAMAIGLSDGTPVTWRWLSARSVDPRAPRPTTRCTPPAHNLKVSAVAEHLTLTTPNVYASARDLGLASADTPLPRFFVRAVRCWDTPPTAASQDRTQAQSTRVASTDNGGDGVNLTYT